MLIGMLGEKPGMLQRACSVLYGWEGVQKCLEDTRTQGRKPSQVLVTSAVALLVLDHPSYFVSL